MGLVEGGVCVGLVEVVRGVSGGCVKGEWKVVSVWG